MKGWPAWTHRASANAGLLGAASHSSSQRSCTVRRQAQARSMTVSLPDGRMCVPLPAAADARSGATSLTQHGNSHIYQQATLISATSPRPAASGSIGPQR